MASKYWLKLYHEMLDDPKVARLNDSAYRRFIECLLMAGELDEGGLLPPLEDMSWRIRVPETALAQDMTRLALGGMVELQEYKKVERWFVSQFAKRQAPSTSAKRVHEFRKRKRKETKEKEEKQKEIQITDTDTYGNVTSNVTPVTNRYNTVTNYDGHEENENTQKQQDTITEICNVAKGQNALMPSDELERFADYLISRGDEDMIPAFRPWWNEHGHYGGPPALKSIINDWENFREDPMRTKPADNGQQLTPLQIKVRALEAKNNVMD